MNKIISTILLFILLSECSYGQTYYYKLKKVITNGRADYDVSGGQFITFTNTYCFESDKYGNAVNNSKLSYSFSSNGVSVYEGVSFLGVSTFKFNSDKSFLNMVTTEQQIYVYEKANAPQGVTTCSLLRNPVTSRFIPGKGEVSPSNNNYNNGNYYSPQNNATQYNSSNTNTTSSQSSSNQKTKVKCSYCNGTGRVKYSVDDNWKFGRPTTGPQAGQTYMHREDERCSECGEKNYGPWRHGHSNCSHCHGNGYYYL